MPGLSPSDILAEIRTAAFAIPKADPMCKRASEWASEWGISPQQALRYCSNAVRAGKMRSEKRPYLQADGTPHTTTHYRYVGKAKR